MPRSEIVQARLDPDLKAEAARLKGEESWQSLIERFIKDFVQTRQLVDIPSDN
jgi:hypothetical protein